MPEVGTIGRYEVLRQIGRGGMAVVYLARQPDLARFVALKELRALHDDDPSHAQRFLREARLAGSLTDPNVVTVYEYFEHDGTPYLAMEYLERGSLRPFVGELNLAQVSGVLEGVLAGLIAAERQDIVHRDLKPENVLVTGDGRVKIADFGIAKATNAMQTGAFQTATGITVGTPAYIAPEQAMAEVIGPWTDLYSVGCMAFELFTGQRPFHDVESPVAILMRHVTHAIPPVTSVAPDVDPRISDWIERLLVKDASERTRSAEQAWDEYEELAIALLGPRWRRDARLRAAGGDAEPEYRTYTDGEPPVPATSRPYTPPPPDLPPGPMAPPPPEPPPPAAIEPQAGADPSAATPPPVDTPPAGATPPPVDTPPAAATPPPVDTPPAVTPPSAETTPPPVDTTPAVTPPSAETTPPAGTPPSAETTPPAGATPPPVDPPPTAAATPPPDVPSGPLAPAEPAEPPRGSRRGLVIGGVVALVVIVGLAAFLATRGDDEEPASPSTTQSAAIPDGNLTSNPSFEENTDGWEPFVATREREPADDAPDGDYVARVTLDGEPSEYSIDDEPDVLETSVVAGTEYVASAWVKATPETDGKPICIALREWTPGRPADTYTGQAEGSVTASVDEWREVKVRYVADQDDNTIDLHVYRYPGEMVANEAFLVDAITITEGTDTSENTQLVDDATCGA